MLVMSADTEQWVGKAGGKGDGTGGRVVFLAKVPDDARAVKGSRSEIPASGGPAEGERCDAVLVSCCAG